MPSEQISVCLTWIEGFSFSHVAVDVNTCAPEASESGRDVSGADGDSGANLLLYKPAELQMLS